MSLIKSMSIVTGLAVGLAAPAAMAQVDLFNNGGLKTGTTTKLGTAAPAGTEWSECQNDAGVTTESNSIAGFGHQLLAAGTADNRIADDFTITDPGGWQIEELVFFAYQTGALSGSPSTMNNVNVRIWRGRPGDTGSTILFGDTTTSLLTTSSFDSIFRIFNTTTPAPGSPSGTTRPVFRNLCRLATPITLGPGTYWLDWQTRGTLASGPWVPSVTVRDRRTVAGWNARQFIFNPSTPTTPGVWQDALDTGSPATAPDVAQDVVFVVRGRVLSSPPPPPPPACFTNCDGSTDPVTGRPTLDVQDFSCFQNAFALGDLSKADCNGDGSLDVRDFTCFQNGFAVGCP